MSATVPKKAPLSSSSSDWQSDLRFSHVDIIVDDLHLFLDKWCPRLGFVPSNIQTWGGSNDPTWSEFAFVFDRHSGHLMFMVVEGKHGAHADLLQTYGSGSIYRLCFKTDNLESCFEHLQATGTKVTNLEGVPFRTFQCVINSGKRILWLEREGELSMEILTASIIDAGCEKLRKEVGLTTTTTTNQGTEPNPMNNQTGQPRWRLGLSAIAALGTAFLLGVLCGRASLLPKR